MAASGLDCPGRKCPGHILRRNQTPAERWQPSQLTMVEATPLMLCVRWRRKLIELLETDA